MSWLTAVKFEKTGIFSNDILAHIFDWHSNFFEWTSRYFWWFMLTRTIKSKLPVSNMTCVKYLYESNTSKQGLFRDNYHQICLRILQVGLEKNVNCELWIWYPKQPDFLFSWLVEYICNHNHVLWRIIIHSPAVSTVSFPLTTKNSLTSVFSLINLISFCY